MPTNKLLEDKLNNWAKNWRRQQEEISYSPQYQAQNQTPYNTTHLLQTGNRRHISRRHSRLRLSLLYRNSLNKCRHRLRS